MNPHLVIVAGVIKSILVTSNIPLKFPLILSLYPFAKFRILLSSNTLLRFSIHLKSTYLIINNYPSNITQLNTLSELSSIAFFTG
jgi:hypothetical protein